MKYSFHPAAETELNRSVDYYDECQKGLGLQFLKEIYRTVQNILAFPMPSRLIQQIPEGVFQNAFLTDLSIKSWTKKYSSLPL